MKKVLIVDDDRDLLEMVELALTEQGYNVCALADGKLFFDQVAEYHPDIILLDIYLGEVDGRKLCYQLKSDPSYQDIPVALYSAGHVNNASIRDSKADAFLTKPFDIMHLGAKLKSLLEKGSTRNYVEQLMDMVKFRKAIWKLSPVRINSKK